MSDPSSPGWIVRVPIPFAGAEKLASQIRTFLAAAGDAARGIDFVDTLDLSGWSGRPDTLVLLNAKDDHPLFSRFQKDNPRLVERNRKLVAIDRQSSETAICGTLDIPKGSPDAKDLHVAVIDITRIDALGASTLHLFDVRKGVVEPISASRSPDSDPHGRRVAGVFAHEQHGAAKGAEVWCYRVETAWDMMKALEHIRDDTPVRVVCAAVAVEDGKPNDERDEVQALHDVIAYVSAREPEPIFVVVSAGNAEESLVKSPAAAPAAITVGALIDVDIVSSLGALNSGKPTFLAPIRPHVRTVNGDCWRGSTSVAAPYVAGLVATWLKERPRLTREDLLRVFRKASHPFEDIAVEKQGWGKLDVREALSLIRELPNPPAPTPPPARSTPEKAAPRRRRKAPAST